MCSTALTQPDQQRGAEKSPEQTQGLLTPCPTPQPPSWVTRTLHGRGTWDLEGEMLCGLPAGEERADAGSKTAISSNHPGAKGCKVEL